MREPEINPATRKSTEVTPWIPLRGLALQVKPTDAGFLQFSVFLQPFRVRISPWSFRRFLPLYIIFLLCFPILGISDITIDLPKGSLEDALFEDTKDGTLNRLSLEQASLIASGVSQRNLVKYIQKIDTLQNHIALKWPMKKLSSLQKGQVILAFLHQTILITYHPEATEIQKTLDQGVYNCVSSTLLFNALCERFGIKTIGIEVPTHVYSCIYDSKNRFDVQTTSPQGFWLKDVPHNEFIYDKDLQTWKGKRQIQGARLIAVIYYNRGIYWIHKKDFAKALPYYCRAYVLDPDFPNLSSLISSLYAAWGNQFFEKGNFRIAAQIYQKGLWSLKTHPRGNILSKNLASALINEANLLITRKEWFQAQSLLDQAAKIGPFDSIIINNQKALYYTWGQEYIDRGEWQKAVVVYQNARKKFPQEKGFHQNLSWTYAKIGEEFLKTHHYKKAREWFLVAYKETHESNFLKITESLNNKGS